MKSYLIIHGHFYQPPREDPESGVIPLQPSAAPYHDWNCRITKECYGANSASRVLNGFGEITDIVNNYRYLSFNFGPTLLDWLRVHSPNVYNKILQGDKESIRANGGHGNAIAQGYNHTILPLDTREDAKIQILWGLDNFCHHFGRESEGIWLPETAVNISIIDLLIDRNIKFIILSPWQAKAFRKKGKTEWEFLGKNPVPSHIPYFIQGTSGTIAVFFYNPELASGISFGHYLHNADELYSKLLNIKIPGKTSRLIHTATDGEIYGHHEPFGDMCLASLIKKVQAGNDFILSNYGKFLEDFPPETEALLHEGQEKKGTSWSCVHGVCRWFMNCGCTTGGEPEWNQEWRAPLRDAFTFLSGRLITEYKKQTVLLAKKDPMEILKAYSSVCNGEISPGNFALQYIPEADHKTRIEFLSLLEGQRYRLYMFTSCGWFFSEISGLEPVQNMRYALKAINLYKKHLSPEDIENFLQILDRAKSNLKEKGSGRDIFTTLMHTYPEGYQAALYFCSTAQEHPLSYGKYILDKMRCSNEETFTVTLSDSMTTKTFTYNISLPGITKEDFSISMKNPENPAASAVITNVQDLDPGIRANFLNNRMTAAKNDYTLSELVFILEYSKFLDTPVPDSFRTKVVNHISRLLKDHLTSSGTLIPAAVFDKMCTLIHLADQLKLSYDRTIPQNIIFENVSKLRKAQIKRGEYIRQMIILCDLMGIYSEDLKLSAQASGQPLP